MQENPMRCDFHHRTGIFANAQKWFSVKPFCMEDYSPPAMDFYNIKLTGSIKYGEREKFNMTQKDKKTEENEGTETNQIAMETTGERAPRSDTGGNLEERAGEDYDEMDSTSGAGGVGAGGGTSGVPT